MDFHTLLSPALHAFTMAGGLLLAILLIEIVSLAAAGFSITGGLDALHHADFHHDLPWLDWLIVKDLPILIHVVLLSGFFFVSGYTLQFSAMALSGAYFTPLMAIAIASIESFVLLRVTGNAIAKIIAFKSLAVSEASLIGLTATIKSPEVGFNNQGEASVTDKNGSVHYIQVMPDVEGKVYTRGETVTIKGGGGSLYTI